MWGASQNQKLTNGLVGLWSFDQPDVAGVIAYDRSGNANNGTLTGGQRTIGKIGQALSFPNQTAQGVDLGNSPAGLVDNTQKSYCAWIYPKSYGSSANDASIFFYS